MLIFLTPKTASRVDADFTVFRPRKIIRTAQACWYTGCETTLIPHPKPQLKASHEIYVYSIKLT